MTDGDLILIVPCYNEGPYLAGNLNQIYNLLKLLNLEFEMIIIEDTSTNDTLQRVQQFTQSLLERHPDLQGFQSLRRQTRLRPPVR